MRTTTADGRQLAWEEYGDPAGPPVFLFHGTPGLRFDSDPFGSPIGARIITPDRPGYGESSPHPTRRLVAWPGDVCTIAARTNPEMIMFVQPWGFDLADITVPVRMWHGGVDVNVPLAHTHHLAADMPTATLTVLPEHGHMSLRNCSPPDP